VTRLLLLSVVVATVALPVLAARDRRPGRGVRRAALLVLAFNVAWALALAFLYPRLSP